jgi:hypothetical protein
MGLGMIYVVLLTVIKGFFFFFFFTILSCFDWDSGWFSRVPRAFFLEQ